MTKTIFKISGMHCASCAANIENALKKETGVKSANVDFAVEKLYLEYDPMASSLEKIKNLVNKLGYQISQDGAAEKEMSSEEHTHHGKVKELKRRFIIALLCGLPIIYMVMGGMIGLPMPMILEKYALSLSFILATAVILATFNIWADGFRNLWRRRPNMNSLIFIGTAVAYFYSLAVSVSAFISAGGVLGNLSLTKDLYYESAVF